MSSLAAGPDSKADETFPWQKSYPPGIEWATAIEPAPIWALLDVAAARYSGRPCTMFLGKSLSYGDISRMVDRAAAGLQRLGVGKGSKVGLFLPNSPTFIIYYYAILKAGGTVVNFNPLYTLEELTNQIKDSDTELMVTLDLKVLFGKVEALLAAGTLQRAIVASFTHLLPASKAILYRLFKAKDLAAVQLSAVAGRITTDADVLDNDGVYQRVDIDPERDVAVLQYTGGTTGIPKGAMLTHANIYVNTLQVKAWAPGMTDGHERILGVLPFFHVFAMTVVMNFGIARAAELAIMPRFVLDDAMRLIDRLKPTCMPGVPTLFNAIANHPKVKSFDLRSLKFCLSGGAPLPLEIKQRFEAVTGCKLVEGYGLSEASPVVTANPLEGPVKEESIGLPLPGTIVSLRDPVEPAREVAQGERGEVCVKGPQVMKGYWKRPKETADVFVGDYLRTGDVGIMDEDGFFRIVDRIKDLIICSGYRVIMSIRAISRRRSIRIRRWRR